MEALHLKHIIPSSYANSPMRLTQTSSICGEFLRVSWIPKKVGKQICRSQFALGSTGSAYQDFQDFAKPLRLVPATEPKTCTSYITEEMLASLALDDCSAFYVLELQTSKDYGSELRDRDAAILICFIDVIGDSILQRISATSLDQCTRDEEIVFVESIHFQRGSHDIVTFKGPQLGNIVALWIGVESGSWRLGGVQLLVISGPLSGSIKDIECGQFSGLQYKFQETDILLGEARGVSMAELRPVHGAELSKDKILTHLPLNVASVISSPNERASNEEGMREYTDLKLSLLVYDMIIISAGSTITTFAADEKVGYAFLFGGISGFLYLLLLQRSVDGLSISASTSMDHNEVNVGKVFGGIKGPLSTLAVILVTSIAAVKYGIGGASVALAPSELFAGVAGFLACKIAVVLAAFRPFQFQKIQKENK